MLGVTAIMSKRLSSLVVMRADSGTRHHCLPLARGLVIGRRRTRRALCSMLVLLGCSAESGYRVPLGDPEPGSSGGQANGTRQEGVGSGANSGGSVRAGGSSGTGQTISIRVANTNTTQPDSGAAGSKASCGSVQVDAQVKTVETVIETPGNVLFVFDQSSSMKETWQGQAKWKAAFDAVVNAFTPVQDKLNAGAILFPLVIKSGCDPTVDLAACILVSLNLCPDVAPISLPPQMTIQSGRTFLAAWKTYWSVGADSLGVGTPTEKGLLQAEAALVTPLPGNTAVVLVTDGKPTCGANESAIAARLLRKNIKTYVVGLPGGAGVSMLDDVAIAGGTAPQGCTKDCYLTPVDATAFQSSLASIVTTTVTTTTEVAIMDCAFHLSPPTGANAEDVHLIVTQAADGQQFEVPKGPGVWTVSADTTTATLEGAVCDAAKSGVLSNLDFRYGCVEVPEWTTPLL